MPISCTLGAGSNNAFGALRSTALSPKFRINLPATKTILQGDNTSLSVLVSGQPTPSYQWYFNNSPLNGETSNTLANVTAAGVYTVVASNNRGSITSVSCTLSVSLGAPVILVQPADDYISRGETAEFYVQATGLGALNYEWYLNDDPLPANTPNTTTLYVPNTYEEAYIRDGNRYKCRVYNTLGEVFSDSVQLKFIGVAPTIISESPDVIVYEGGIVNLAIEAVGYPTPLIEWFLPNNQSTITGTTLSFTADASIYSYGDNYINYRVSNIYGQANGTIKVNIKQYIAPLLRTSLPTSIERDVDPYTGEIVNIFADVVSDPPVQLSIQDAEGNVVASINSSSGYLPLNLYPADPEFTVENPDNFDWSGSEEYYFVISYLTEEDYPYLPPLPPPAPIPTIYHIVKPVIVTQPTALIISDLGETQTLTVQAADRAGGASLTYSWRKMLGSTPDSLSDPVLSTTNTCNIQVNNLNQDNTKYYCAVSNSKGWARTIISTLLLAPSIPQITQQPVSQNAVGACTITGTFSVTAFQPAPLVSDYLDEYGIPYAGAEIASYTWYVNGVAQPGSSNTFVFLSSSLQGQGLTNPATYDENTYDVYVKVKNRYGNTSQSAEAQLLIALPAVILADPVDQIVTDFSPFSFAVEVCRPTLYIYQWYKNGIEIPGANTAVFSKNEASVDDEGTYYCVVSLPDGSSPVTSDSALLVVTEY
jgi:hypothetical protein